MGKKDLSSMAIGHRSGESRVRGHIEANETDRINLKDIVASVIHGNRCVGKNGATERRNGFLAMDFSGIFL